MGEVERLTDDDLKLFATLRDQSQAPRDTEHNAECACVACDEQVEAAWKARGALEALRDLDAVGRLLAEVRRLKQEDEARDGG